MSAIFETPLGLFGPLFLIALVIVGIVVVVSLAQPAGDAIAEFRRNADTSASHAVERHGANTVEQIRHCIRNGGYLKSFYNEDTDRWLDLCMLPGKSGDFDGTKFGMRVCHEAGCSGFSEITAFKQNARLDEVLEYLQRRGYREALP